MLVFLYLSQAAEGQCRGSLVDDSHYMAVASGATNKLTELLSESVKMICLEKLVSCLKICSPHCEINQSNQTKAMKTLPCIII